LCSVIQTTQLGYILVFNTTTCVTLRTLYQHLKGVNMDLEIEPWDLRDLDIELGDNDKLIAEWELDIEYSPDEGVYDEFSWTLCIVTHNGQVTDITDDLSYRDTKFIEKQIEKACHDEFQ